MLDLDQLYIYPKPCCSPPTVLHVSIRPRHPAPLSSFLIFPLKLEVKLLPTSSSHHPRSQYTSLGLTDDPHVPWERHSLVRLDHTQVLPLLLPHQKTLSPPAVPASLSYSLVAFSTERIGRFIMVSMNFISTIRRCRPLSAPSPVGAAIRSAASRSGCRTSTGTSAHGRCWHY